jgi:hypothetical protein
MAFFSNLFVTAKNGVMGLAGGWYLYAIIATASFGGGIYATHIYYKAQETSAAQAQVKQIVKQEAVNGKVSAIYEGKIQTLQQNIASLGDRYALLEKQKRIVTSKCKLTPDAVKLWNSSSQGLPPDTTPTVNTPNTTGTVSSTASDTGNSAGVEFGAAIKNKLEWDAYNAQLKEKLLAIKQWQKEQYGK